MWSAFFQTFDPWSNLGPEKVDDLYVGRPGAPGRRIARRIEGAGHLGRWVLCGARGCGKSTELAWIAHHLRLSHRVVHVDISHALPDGAGMLAVLVVVGAAVVARLEEWQGADEASQARTLRGGLVSALEAFGWTASSLNQLMDLVPSVLIQTDWGQQVGADALAAGAVVARNGLAAAARLAEKKAVELRTLLDRDGLGGALRPEHREKAAAVGDAVNAAISSLSLLTHQQVVLLVDGVDRQPRAAITFADASLLTRIEAPFVLTAPIQLRHDAGLTALPGCSVEKVPNLKVVDREGGVQEDMVQVLVDMVQRRLDHATEAVQRSLRAEQVRAIAPYCSGIPRELIEMIRVAGEEAMDSDRNTVTDADLLLGVKARRLRNGEVLRTPDWDVLAQALDTGEVPGEAADTLLFNNLLICYYNDTVWYRPHETLVSELRRRGLAKTRA